MWTVQVMQYAQRGTLSFSTISSDASKRQIFSLCDKPWSSSIWSCHVYQWAWTICPHHPPRNGTIRFTTVQYASLLASAGSSSVKKKTLLLQSSCGKLSCCNCLLCCQTLLSKVLFLKHTKMNETRGILCKKKEPFHVAMEWKRSTEIR